MGSLTNPARGFRAAASFLTRIPLAIEGDGPEAGLRWFPVVGAAIGLIIGVTYGLAQSILPSLVAAALAVALGALVTGAFHEDGLADTADAFGGGWTREDVLRILKDPRQGTFGVLALVLSSMLKIGAIAAFDPWAALVVLPAAHAFSRSGAVGLLAFVPPATGEGLGASYARSIGRSQIGQTAVTGVVIAALLMGVWLLPAAAAAIAVLVVLARMTVTKAGGLTGDVLGAAQQAVEIAVLMGASAIVTNGWGTFPWWRT